MPVARIAEAAPPDGTRRLLAGARADRRPYTYDEHIRRYGRVELADGLIDVVLASGLRGRGGGAFPTGLKLRAVAEARRRPVVVVNGAEGEPASRKDKALLRAAPHLVLDGAVAAASAVGVNVPSTTSPLACTARLRVCLPKTLLSASTSSLAR